MCKLPHTTATVLLMAACAGAAEPPASKELEQLWADLGAKDPVQVDRAMTRLVSQPADTVRFLEHRLRRVSVPDSRRLAAWFAELDSEEFAVREQATHELEKLGEVIEPALKQALRPDTSPEVRRRIERLLGRVMGERLSPSTGRLRAVRAIEVLERIGDRAARRLLAAMAGGAPEAQLTIEAKTALERLTQSRGDLP